MSSRSARSLALQRTSSANAGAHSNNSAPTASLRRAGRRPAIRSYDAMIAAVAIVNDLPLCTCTPDDFAGIDDLDIVTVLHPQHP